jgi:hypothetical protein
VQPFLVLNYCIALMGVRRSTDGVELVPMKGEAASTQ